MFKKIVAFVTGKVETAIEQNTSPEEAWRSAARILIKELILVKKGSFLLSR